MMGCACCCCYVLCGCVNGTSPVRFVLSPFNLCSNKSRLHVWNRPEEDLSSGKLESTHPSRTIVKSIEVFYVVESLVRGNADSLLN